jgi:single-stranded DNA-binding protein
MIDLLSGSYLRLIGQGRISRLGKLESLNGKRFFKFSVAHNIMKHVEYVNYVAYDKQADYLESYATTGTTVYVESTPHTNRWQDPKSNTGKFISKISYRVEAISFIANIKDSMVKQERELTNHEIGDLQDSMKDEHYISIAKNILKDAGYEITKGDSNVS